MEIKHDFYFLSKVTSYKNKTKQNKTKKQYKNSESNCLGNLRSGKKLRYLDQQVVLEFLIETLFSIFDQQLLGLLTSNAVFEFLRQFASKLICFWKLLTILKQGRKHAQFPIGVQFPLNVYRIISFDYLHVVWNWQTLKWELGKRNCTEFTFDNSCFIVKLLGVF